MGSTQNGNRIKYVDPNDIHGNINGAPVTPDYTDFCIWCNLIVETTSRLKNHASMKSKDDKFSMVFDIKRDGTQNVSFLRGKDVDNYNFLTTDYTNIDFDEIKKRNIIEGLEIQSVDISFVNYQTPQVVIKFVDIRGGGFFGREEATHNGNQELVNLERTKNDNIIDNFFSCFVTFPYPRFRLQVKGFYGKPVTFQLTCTNFQGNFNSTTGNFEITVQFIGYEYGILGDIPFDFLVAAPYTEFGSNYWNEHVENMTENGWALDANKTEKPIKLYEFYNNIIKEADSGNEDLSEVDDGYLPEIIGNIHKQKEQLHELKSVLDKRFKATVKECFGSENVIEYTDSKEEIMLISSDTQVQNYNDKIVELNKACEELMTAYNKYNSQYKSGDIKLVWEQTQLGTITFGEFFDYINDNKIAIKALNADNKVTNTLLTDSLSCTGFTVKNLYKSEYYHISEGVSDTIRTVTLGLGSTGKKFGRYLMMIDFNRISFNILSTITTLSAVENDYTRKMNDPKRRSISSIVGFTPYIGRYFKNVMCHLETFVALVNNYAQVIDDNLANRTPANLGISNSQVQTDVPGIGKDIQIPPFPAVYKNDVSGDEIQSALDSDAGKSIVVNTWIGDFKGNEPWVEEKLVDEIYKAIQKINQPRLDESKKESQSGDSKQDNVVKVQKNDFISLNPFDYLSSSIPPYSYTTKDGAMFYGALRAELALDLLQNGKEINDDLAYKLGVIDGTTYYNQGRTIKCYKNKVKEAFSGINNISDELYNSTVSSDKFRSSNKMLYETEDVLYFDTYYKTYSENRRQPVFTEVQNQKSYYLPQQEPQTKIPQANNNNDGYVKYSYFPGVWSCKFEDENKKAFYDYDIDLAYVPISYNNTTFEKNGMFIQDSHGPIIHDMKHRAEFGLNENSRAYIGIFPHASNENLNASEKACYEYYKYLKHNSHVVFDTKGDSTKIYKERYKSFIKGNANICGESSSNYASAMKRHVTVMDKEQKGYIPTTIKYNKPYSSYEGINDYINAINSLDKIFTESKTTDVEKNFMNALISEFSKIKY